MQMWKISLAAPALAGVFALSGCGDGGATNAPAPQPQANAPAAQQEQAVSGTIPEPMQAFEDDGNVAELFIEGTDRMQFNRDHFLLRPGEMVRLTLEHTGQLPIQSMGHNVVVLKLGEDPFEFGADVNEQGGSLDNEYVPNTLRDRVIAFTEMIGGGETTTVEFKAPEVPGQYPFLCSFPGHAGMMNGVMEVQE